VAGKRGAGTTDGGRVVTEFKLSSNFGDGDVARCSSGLAILIFFGHLSSEVLLESYSFLNFGALLSNFLPRDRGGPLRQGARQRLSKRGKVLDEQG
jgi:hypothetical protein